MTMIKYCHSCRTEWTGGGQPGFKEACLKCAADLHVCFNCRFYDTGKPYDCAEHIVESITDKAKANYCELFQFIERNPGQAGPHQKNAGKDAFNKLFNK